MGGVGRVGGAFGFFYIPPFSLSLSLSNMYMYVYLLFTAFLNLSVVFAIAASYKNCGLLITIH